MFADYLVFVTQVQDKHSVHTMLCILQTSVPGLAPSGLRIASFGTLYAGPDLDYLDSV